MSRKVGLFAGLGVAVLLVSGLVAGVALAQGGGDGGAQVEPQSFAARVASHLGVTEQQLVDAAKTARLEMLEEAVAVGNISPEDAEQIRKRIEESQGLGFGLRGWRVRALGGIVSSVAETLDMTPREISQAGRDRAGQGGVRRHAEECHPDRRRREARSGGGRRQARPGAGGQDDGPPDRQHRQDPELETW
jgi:hypothetical protein